jgi:hypothetical protein
VGLGVSPLIPGGGGIDPGLLPEQTLHTPETAHAEPGKLHPLGPGPLGQVTVYRVHLANLQRFRRPGSASAGEIICSICPVLV